MISAIVVLVLMLVLVGGFSFVVYLDTVGNRKISRVQNTVSKTDLDLQQLRLEVEGLIDLYHKVEDAQKKIDIAMALLNRMDERLNFLEKGAVQYRKTPGS